MYSQTGDNRLFSFYAGSMNSPNLDYASFLIRLWREPAALLTPQAAGREWLIQIEHIPDGEKEYLTSLEDLCAFIQARLSRPSQESR
jgi:hypothetical protein